MLTIGIIEILQEISRLLQKSLNLQIKLLIFKDKQIDEPNPKTHCRLLTVLEKQFLVRKCHLFFFRFIVITDIKKL